MGHMLLECLGLCDGGNFQQGKSGTEAFLLVEAFTTFELESNALFASDLLDYFSFYYGVSYGRGAYFDPGLVLNKKNFVKNSFCVFLQIKAIYHDAITLLYSVLFATGLENCVCHVM